MGMLLLGSTGMIGGYAGIFLVAPVLAYKTFFRGGVLPGVPENKEVAEEPTKVQVMANRWCGLMMLQNVLNITVMTKGFEENQNEALQLGAVNWALAAAMHVPAMLTKTQPKELCVQQLVVMPVIALANFLASRD